ncbi:hypothetical protein ACUHMQ_04875 [Chitinimonas sp. PSY-7]|uniref:hypothetical protein n=1 Tax=Chitinimonas sp. PSY-7 TaxID=3459088 RepID=UPI00403FCF77
MNAKVTRQFAAQDVFGNSYSVLEITDTVSFARLGEELKERKAGVRYQLKNGLPVMLLSHGHFYLPETSIVIAIIQ